MHGKHIWVSGKHTRLLRAGIMGLSGSWNQFLPRYHIRKIRSDTTRARSSIKFRSRGCPTSGKSYTIVYMRIHVCAVPTLQMPLSVWPPSRPRITVHCCLYPLFRQQRRKTEAQKLSSRHLGLKRRGNGTESHSASYWISRSGSRACESRED